MSETRRRPRWWRWLALVILLILAATIAWQFRPLNEMERRLVGTWDIHDGRPAGLDGFIRFAADRRYMFWFRSRGATAGLEIPDIAGSWHASDPWLRYSYDSPTRDLWSFLRREWVLHSTGMSRTTSTSLIPVKAASGEDSLSYRSTDPSVPVTLRPLSAADRARLGPEAPSPKREPDRP